MTLNRFKIGHQRTWACHFERVGIVVRNDSAVLSPAHEHLACLGRGSQRGIRALRVGACASNATAIARVGRGVDGVVDGEVGHVCGAFGHCESKVCISRHHSSVLRPIDEGGALVGCGGQRACAAQFVSTVARGRAAIAGVTRRTNRTIRSVANQTDGMAVGAVMRVSTSRSAHRQETRCIGAFAKTHAFRITTIITFARRPINAIPVIQIGYAKTSYFKNPQFRFVTVFVSPSGDREE